MLSIALLVFSTANKDSLTLARVFCDICVSAGGELRLVADSGRTRGPSAMTGSVAHWWRTLFLRESCKVECVEDVASSDRLLI